MRRISQWTVMGAACVATLLLGATAASANDSCREWKREHKQWMTAAVGRYLHGAPQAELDAAVFEVLQREAYLTSCEVSTETARNEMVGWRLVGRSPEDYGSAVLETVLACSGFDLDMRRRFAGSLARPVAATPPAPRPRYNRRAR